MPLILAGLTWLATFLGTLSAQAAAWISLYLTKRLALIAVAIASIAAASAVFYAALGAAASAVVTSAPSWVVVAASWVVPSNAQACVTAIVAGHTARLLYVWQHRIITMNAQA